MSVIWVLKCHQAPFWLGWWAWCLCWRKIKTHIFPESHTVGQDYCPLILDLDIFWLSSSSYENNSRVVWRSIRGRIDRNWLSIWWIRQHQQSRQAGSPGYSIDVITSCYLSVEQDSSSRLVLVCGSCFVGSNGLTTMTCHLSQDGGCHSEQKGKTVIGMKWQRQTGDWQLIHEHMTAVTVNTEMKDNHRLIDIQKKSISWLGLINPTRAMGVAGGSQAVNRTRLYCSWDES